MADEIKNSDLFEDDLFGPVVENGKAALKILDLLEQGFKDLAKTINKDLKNQKIEDNVESLQKLEKTLKDAAKVQKGANKVTDQRLKLEEKLAAATEEDAVELQKLKVQISQANKETKELAKEQLGLTSEYQKQSKRLRDLKNEYKDLILREGEAAEGAEDLKNEIDDLDQTLKDLDKSVGDNFRTIGDYSGGIQEALGETALFKEETEGLKKIFDLVRRTITLNIKEEIKEFKQKRKAINQNKRLTRSQRRLRKANLALRASFRVLGRAIRNVGFAAAAAGAASVGTALRETESGSLQFAKATAQVNSALDVLKGRAGNAGNAILDFFKAGFGSGGGFAQLNRAGAALDDLGDSFLGIGDQIADANEKATKTAELEFNFRKLNRELQVTIAELAKEQELQAAIADDATKSFAVRNAAASESRRLLEAQREAEIKLAQEELTIINRRVEAAQAAGLFNQELFDEQTSAQTALIEAEKAFNLALRDNAKQRAELRQDELERDLDIEIDGFDNIKSINERRIADERLAFIERQKILEQTTDLSDISFNAQIETIQKFTKARVDADALLAEQDATRLNAQIRSLGLSEIIEGRLLEVIRERRTVLQDLADLEKDLGDARIALQEEINTIEINQIEDSFERQKIERQKQFLDTLDQIERNGLLTIEKKKELAEMERELFEQDLEQIQAEQLVDQVDFAEKLATAQLDQQIARFEDEKDFIEFKERELTKIQLDAAKKRLEALEGLEGEENMLRREQLKAQIAQLEADLNKFNEKNKEAFAETVEATVEIAQGITEALNDEIDKRIAAIDREIEASKERSDQIAENAQRGSQLASDSLAFEEKKRAELELERERRLAQQKRNEAALAVLQRYSQAVTSGDERPLVTTIREAGSLISFINSLAGFYEGTEYLDETPNLPGNKDNILIRAHKGERIVDAEGNKEIGDMTNDELVALAGMYNRGEMIDASEMQHNAGVEAIRQVPVAAANPNTALIASQLQTIAQGIASLPAKMPRHNIQVDQVAKLIIDEFAAGNRIERKIINPGGIFDA